MKAGLLVIAFLIFVIIVGPFLTIWALDTLFPLLAIPYTLETWVAVVILGGLFRANVSVKK
jgi:hypothetical protein